MAKTKKQPKAKEQVRLRVKTLSNGNKSLYLDIYEGGKRSYEFLKLYLVPSVDEAARAANANTLQVANAIKAQRTIDITNGKAGIKTPSQRGRLLLVDWLEQYIARQHRQHTAKTCKTYALVGRILRQYRGDAVRLCDIDKAYCRGLIDFMQHTYTTPAGKRLSAGSAALYLSAFGAVLTAAVREGVLASSPLKELSAEDKIHPQQSQREYLTIDEVRTLLATPRCHRAVPSAFLFACFCGLRVSDIRALTWGDVQHDGDNVRLAIRMQKTRELLYLPLSAEALRWLPSRGAAAATDKVFSLPTISAVNGTLQRWVSSAGIAKHITFHCSRHTFATMLLTRGADLYTTSKLLGHTDVATTQIYAKIVDDKKVEAVNLLNIFN